MYKLKIGFQITEQAIWKTFAKIIKDPGKFHMENRFDPKTGRPKKPEKVYDINPFEYIEWNIDNQSHIELSDEEGFEWVEKVLRKLLKCNVLYEDCMFEIFLKESLYSFAINEVVKTLPKLEQLKQKLQSLGLKVKNPEIYVL